LEALELQMIPGPQSVEQYAETHQSHMGITEAISKGMVMWVSGHGWIHMDEINQYTDVVTKQAGRG
jgi:hypothetical protein